MLLFAGIFMQLQKNVCFLAARVREVVVACLSGNNVPRDEEQAQPDQRVC